MKVRLMSDLDLKGKTVVFREDLNVPVKEGRITSDKRIRAAIPSLRRALDNGCGDLSSCLTSDDLRKAYFPKRLLLPL